MKEDQGLTQLIGDIYDAALDSSRWTSVLAKIAGFAGGQAAGLSSKDSISKTGNIHYQSGVDPYFVRLYAETYWKFDPVASLPDCEVEQIVSVPDLVSYDEFRAGRFYREWAQPQGWIDAANAVLEKTATSCAYLSIVRNEASGMVDDDMRRRMRLIVPHVRRAVRHRQSGRPQPGGSGYFRRHSRRPESAIFLDRRRRTDGARQCSGPRGARQR